MEKFRSKYGLKICNYDAAIIDECNRGIRKYMSFSRATFPNSLLCDYLLKHGLKVTNGNTTKDIIGIEFSYGCKSFDQEMNKLNKKWEEAESEEEKNFYDELKALATKNKDLYQKKTKAELREQFYTEGVTIKYDFATITYVPLYRSSGKAKLGQCVFINKELYEDAIGFLRMGMKFEENQELDIVSLQAYSALAASSIKDRIYIDPDEILVINDVDSIFYTNVISVETDDEKHCITREIDSYPLKNTLFDGQSLIDDSLWYDHWEGYILLRNLFFKSAAFHSNIQLFFKDYFGDQYETATVTDMWGRKLAAKNIKLITTNNSIKWQKFPVDFDYWAYQIREKTESNWGIVKSAYMSKLGDVQRMSYQMINSLDMFSMDSVIKVSREYIDKLKTDDETFIEFLKRDTSFANDYEVLIDLYRHNPKIVESDYFRRRRKQIIYNYCLDFKNGRAINNADNLVIVGSPYAMLLAAVGEDCLKLDGTFEPEAGAIQVSTKRFADDTYLASFRSPFNSQNNLCLLHNVYSPVIDKYFPFGSQIIAVNMIGTDFQARNNGSDQDSDSVYVTDQPAVVECARRCVKEYPTIENRIPKETNHYINCPQDFAAVDTKIASANMAIGESSNLAQLCLTYGYNFSDKKYKDYACILAVLAQVAIDNAKRSFDLDLNKEIRRIKADLNIKENGLPLFWFYIKRKGKFAKRNNDRQVMQNFNPSLVCPMNYLCEVSFTKFHSKEKTIPTSSFLIKRKPMTSRKTNKRAENFIGKYGIDLKEQLTDENAIDLVLSEMEFEELLSDLRRLYVSKEYQDLMLWLLRRGLSGNEGYHEEKTNCLTKKNRPILLKTLYNLNKDIFLSCFKKENEM